MSVHVRIPVMASLCLLLAVVVAAAGTLTVEGPGGVSLAIMSELPMTDAGPQPALRGEVAIAPVTERLDGCPLMLYVDDRPLALAGEGATEFSLDTTGLEDGRHTVRVDALRGEQLIASTGSIYLGYHLLAMRLNYIFTLSISNVTDSDTPTWLQPHSAT